MTISAADFVEIFKASVGSLQGCIWPSAIILVLVLYREPLSRLIGGLSGRITKFSAFQFAIEVATVREVDPALSTVFSAANPLDPTTATEGIFGYEELIKYLNDPSTSDYLVIDIGNGREWLTSRVFIYSIMLQRMKGIRCVVFVTSSDGLRRKFIGLASPEQVRWSFAYRFPFLERTFSAVYRKENDPVGKYYGMPDFFGSTSGSLPPEIALKIVGEVLGALRHPPFPPPSDGKEIPAEPVVQQWEITNDPRHESPWIHTPWGWQHAKWLDVDLLNRLLGAAFRESSVVSSPDSSAAETTKAILHREGQFIALVDNQMQFKHLIDRYQLLEQVALRVIENTPAVR